MSDAVDHDGLYRLAESQAGYFTTQQALAMGMQRSTLRHYARPDGQFERVRRGLYRLRHFPSRSKWLSGRRSSVGSQLPDDCEVRRLRVSRPGVHRSDSDRRGDVRYQDAAAFCQALEHRLKARSDSTGVGVEGD
jgi:hypothetical protein